MTHIHGGDIYAFDQIKDFSANINFRGMPDTVRAAVVDAVALSVNYPDPQYRELKKAIAKREFTSQEHLIFGNGAAELLFAFMLALKPEKVLLAVPSFYEYEQALNTVSCQIERYDTTPHEFRVAEDFADAITEETDLVILGNPNNPTGTVIDKDVLERIIRACQEHHVFLLVDESFFDFLDEETLRRTCSCVEKTAMCPQLFVLKSFTKMYAIPGIRFGYGVCSDTELLQKMHLYLQPWNVSVLAQAAGCAAAKEIDFACETAHMVSQNRKKMYLAMQELGYRYYPSDTNFLLFEGPADLGDYCKEHGYLIRDCSNFPGLTKQETGKSFYRICIRSEEENEALRKVLGDALAERKE